MFDSHVHYDAAELSADLDAVAASALAAGVTGAVNPAIDLASSRKTLELGRRFPWLLPALGFHPLYLGALDDCPVAELEALAREGRYAAVGEVGLDFWAGREDEDRQRRFLADQARLATRLGVPLLLHVRRAFYETFAVLREAGYEGGGVAHAFSGSRDMARLALDRGFHLSACAVLTRPTAGGIRDVFRWASRDRLLVETDAPDLPPWPRKGPVHRPDELPVTVAALADALGAPVEEVAELTEANARALFGAPARPRGAAP